MKYIIRICHEQGLDLATEVRKYLQQRPKEEPTGIYKGN